MPSKIQKKYTYNEAFDYFSSKVNCEESLLFDDFSKAKKDIYTHSEVRTAIFEARSNSTQLKHQAARERLTQSCKGKLLGLEASKKSGHLFACIMGNAHPTTPFRVQYYDAQGLSGHGDRKTLDDALSSMIKDGFVVPAHGAMSRLSKTDEWVSGNAQMELARQSWSQKEHIQKIESEVDKAYEQGDLDLAENLDALLAQSRYQLELEEVDTLENEPDNDAEYSLDEGLASTYKSIFIDKDLEHNLGPFSEIDDVIANMRDNIELSHHSESDAVSKLSDQDIIQIAKEAYEYKINLTDRRQIENINLNNIDFDKWSDKFSLEIKSENFNKLNLK
ncbi:MAG: hypothetical protein QM500_16780 [Methylococcales bacterium]